MATVNFIAMSSITRAPCNRCLQETRHSVLFQKKREDPELDGEGGLAYMETTKVELLECRGCENITMRSTYQFNKEEPDVSYFPPAVTRPTPRWLSHWEFRSQREALYSMFQEVYAALHAGSHCLAMRSPQSGRSGEG